MEDDVPNHRSAAAFGVFLLALAGVTISASALIAIAAGLGWDGMPWTIALLAALLMAISSSARLEHSSAAADRGKARHEQLATWEARAGAGEEPSLLGTASSLRRRAPEAKSPAGSKPAGRHGLLRSPPAARM